MGKVVEKKKKKGRPSLLDLQKRNLKQQQQQQQQNQQQKRNSNSAPHSTANYKTAPASTTTHIRRSTRRNPNPDASSSPQKLHAEEDDVDGDGGEEEEEELDGKRREKKLKLVLRLPPNQKSSLNSGSLNSYGSDSNGEEDNAASEGNKKRKINAIGDGSGVGDSKKLMLVSLSDRLILFFFSLFFFQVDKSSSGTILKGATKLDSGPSTPLPDKKLLLFILDRLQKKDTYCVFSEPVDPEELPDYHEVIEHPMDFSTVRKKLTGGSYTSLEEFEKDVFLICSNAMQYNAPDTIYFRQARSIQELAKKNFENLRQDSDDNEPEPKVVRRGRPPTKNLKKPLGRPSLERAGSEFSSDATLATAGENTAWTNYDLRKGSHASDRSGLADSSGRFHVSRNMDAHASWLADSKFEKNDDFTGSLSKGNSKQGKKQFVHEENRRNTYMQSNPSAGGREPSVFTTFDGERKQLMPVGIQSEYGYARSLARFAANLGSVAWKIASKKIERSLPAGVKYGPGWVAENDLIQNRPLLPASQLPGQPSPSQPIPDLVNSSSAATTSPVESNRDKLADRPEGENSSHKRVPSATSTLDGHLSKPLTLSATTTSSPSVANKPCEPHTAKAEPVEGLKPQTGFNLLNSNVGALRPRPPFQVRQGPMVYPGMNGYNGAYGLNVAAQMGKLIRAARPAGLNFQSSPMIDPKSRTNTNVINPANANANSIDTEDSKFSDNRSTINPGNSLSNPGNEAPAAQIPGPHPRPSWSGLSPHQKSDSGLSPQQKQASVPPDLNVMFQSPGSPSSSKVDSTQPDLALQL
ncbi:hypothetical protein FEM48_Zijuj09G0152100 [Ziziphus jujuba var. spinosa]|uniref:Bromo domain-containing protein n=1 Tax=Ziziphus jujuba var. spinosa TaxID=714518 RepID=A0A978UTQ5_ZIZJJ|nr:hypothetical protein FEM48_Zijuj09G0152100 [Ziziphus jujuba var. spinosa]